MADNLPGPPQNTGQPTQKDLEQTKVYLDILRRMVEANFTALSSSLSGLSFTPAGYVKATGTAFTNQAVPIPVADGGTGRTTLTAAAYLKGDGTNPVAFQAPPIPAADLALKSARVYKDSATTISNVTDTVLTFNSEAWDSDAFHSTSSNTDRLTAPVAGKYMVGGEVDDSTGWTDGAVFELYIEKNGTTAVADHVVYPGAGGGVPRIQVVTIIDLAAGDYVRLRVFQSTGGDISLVAGNKSQVFWICQVGN